MVADSADNRWVWEFWVDFFVAAESLVMMSRRLVIYVGVSGGLGASYFLNEFQDLLIFWLELVG